MDSSSEAIPKTSVTNDQEEHSINQDHPMEGNSFDYKPQLTDLPEEILERILSFLSPYNDQESAKLVCHQWYRLILSLVKQLKKHFYQGIGNRKIGWTEVFQSPRQRNSASPQPGFRLLSVSERYSHSCAYLNGSMYVFGGCTSTNTTFNDLWRLDLTTRKWIRPIAMGSYPSPKACASMVVYKGKLVLFGGWSHPIPYPLHQSANYFNELHVYDPVTNRWNQLHSVGAEPDSLGGHSASIVGDKMVVFGGSPRPGQGCNTLWVYDFLQSFWYIPKTKKEVIPEPRYGQYQCTLDDKTILMMGGCGGPIKIYNDFYLLHVSELPYYWTKLEVLHPEFAPRQTWCHSVCKVNNHLVVLCKSTKQREMLNRKPSVYYADIPAKQDQKPVTAESQLNKTLPSHHEGPKPLQEKDTAHPLSFTDLNNQAGDVCGAISAPPASTQAQATSSNRSLLALQQKLHRKCEKLTDEETHHQHKNNDEEDTDSVAEGQIHRLQNRVASTSNNQDGNNDMPHSNPAPSDHHHHHHHHQYQHHSHRGEPSHPQSHQEANQPHAGQIRRPLPTSPSNNMPSIRPNASSNRQKQLEALNRQEEILKARAKALSEARRKSKSESMSSVAGLNLMEEEENAPTTVDVKNHMDAHIVDISDALTTGHVEWKAESPLQPVGAPMETVCCSLVEGRGELILFGGVRRETTIPMMQNTALNKLYILHS